MINKNYDIIGDIHGQALELTALLKKLGYEQKGGVYKHSERMPVFTGDLIDGGLHNEEVINIVRPMVDSGSAHAVMGNHEFNAICYHTLHPETGQPLREHSAKNFKQHESFLMEFGHRPEKLKEIISWFKTLPLYLDLNGVRIVHAEWHQELIESVKLMHPEGDPLSDESIIQSAQKGTSVNLIIETLLKGSEKTLPNGISFNDKSGHKRYEGRLCWWERKPRPDNIFMVPEETAIQLLNVELPEIEYAPYGANMPPVFFGHYWLRGKPDIQASNAVCVDYSVGKEGGKLCCYSFNDGEDISADNFVSVERFEY